MTNKRNQSKYNHLKEAWRQRNITAVREYQREYQRQWRKSNADKKRAIDKKSRLKNAEKRKKHRREHCKTRYKNDINYRLQRIYYGGLSSHIKQHGKQNRTISYLGCTIEELKQHLESQFKDGMDWSNYGIYGWHIDHIIPCAAFDFTKEANIKQCWHYTNLQPLWAEDNIIKGDRLKDGTRARHL